MEEDDGKMKIADSNIAMLGSDLEKEVRKAAAESAEEWKGAGTKEGTEIWRIEKFNVIAWPKDNYGEFYSGDSYIVLYTYKKPDADSFLFNVHFWLGEHTSQDEAGVAAYKTVELDDLLGTLPVQYREVMGFESNEFLSLWAKKGGMKILEGGVDSGFNHVKPEEYKPRLLHVKGNKHNVRAKQVDCSGASLNDGDVFILDCGMTIYTWTGASAGAFEKRKAGEVVADIIESRNGKPKKVFLESGDDDDTFWDALGGKVDIPKADDKDAAVAKHEKKLYKLSDAKGDLQITEVAKGKLSKKDLDSADVFIVDCEVGLFVWIGSETSKDEKANAFKYANKILEQNDLPLTTAVCRVVDGSDNHSFDNQFEK